MRKIEDGNIHRVSFRTFHLADWCNFVSHSAFHHLMSCNLIISLMYSMLSLSVMFFVRKIIMVIVLIISQ